EIDVVDAELGGDAARGLDHERGEVARDEPPVAELAGGAKSGLAGAGGELDDRLPSRRGEPVDEPFGHAPAGAPDDVPPALPRSRELLPYRVALLPVFALHCVQSAPPFRPRRRSARTNDVPRPTKRTRDDSLRTPTGPSEKGVAHSGETGLR